jgi:O-antigen/teichoic acid export membrane protein
MSKIKKLAGETVLYGLGTILPRMLNFLLVVIHTRSVFNPAEYGVVTNLYAYASFIAVIFSLGMETAFFRFATREGAVVSKVFNLTQTCVVAVSGSLSLLFILCSAGLAGYLGVGGHPEFVIWLVLTLFIDAVVSVPFAQLRLRKKALLFASAKVINVVLQLGLNYYFLKVSYNPAVGVGYVFLANLLSNSFFILFFLRTLLSWRPKFDAELSPRILQYAWPVMLTGIPAMMNEMFSRIALRWWLPEDFYGLKSSSYALGLFGAAYKFAMLMNLSVMAFRYAAEPFFFSHASDKKSPELFARVNHFFVITCCLLLLGVGINMDVLKHFVGEDYWGGLSIVPILLLAYLFLGVYYNMSVWYKLTDQTYYGTIITVAGSVVTIGANYFLIPMAGYTGSSWAALICYFSMMVACYWLGQKKYPIPYWVLQDGLYILCTTGLVYGVNALDMPTGILASAFHFFVIGVFLVVVYFIEGRRIVQSSKSKV